MQSNVTPTIRLRPYQNDCLDAVDEAYRRGIRAQAVQLPTGAGKTVLFSELVRRRGGRSLILAHRDELIEQARDKLRMVAPDIGAGIVKAERNEWGYQATVASVQTLARERRLAQMPGPFDTVVVDEAHHAVAPTFRAVLDAACGPETLLLGVSATLRRTDRAALGQVFEEITYELSPLWMIEQGYLVDVRGLAVEVDADFRKLKKRNGDYADEDLADMLDASMAYDASVAAFKQHAPGRKALVFAPTVASASKFASVFESVGVTSAVVHGAMDVDDRRSILADFKRGRIQALCNCMVLTEGYDEPSVDCIVMARPTRSQALYTQILGRGLRPNPPDKEDCLMIDLVGVSRDLDAVTVPTLFGLDASDMPGAGVSLTAAIARKKAAEAEKAKAVAAAVEILSEEVEVFKQRSKMHWTRAGEDDGRIYTLAAGKDMVSVRPAGDGWQVALHTPPVPGMRRAQTSVLQDGLDLGYAMGAAEDYVREAGVEILNRPENWRGGNAPASDKQLSYLRRLGVRPDRPLTKAEASVLINEAKASQLVRGGRQ